MPRLVDVSNELAYASEGFEESGVRAQGPRGRQVCVTHMGRASYQVRLEGAFRPGWAGNVCAGLSSAGISVDRAYAVRGPDARWRAEFDVRQLHGGPSPKDVPYALLTEKEPNLDAADALAIESFSITPSAAHGGSLELALEARDALGFLGTLLGKLAFVSLFPVELRVETHGDHVLDRLWLTGVGGGAPSVEARVMLLRELQRRTPKAPTPPV